jgi:hypothetical protein
MAEEETGFTFVDKRHSEAIDSSPEMDAEPTESMPNAVENTEPDISEQTPSVYDVIGYCISLLATEAWQKLGLLADPQTGESLTDLVQAKVAIDSVTALANQLDNAPNEAVPDPLRRDLHTLLNDLRLNYVSRRGDDPLSRN